MYSKCSESSRLIQTMQLGTSQNPRRQTVPPCVGTFLPPTQLETVQRSNNNLMTSKHTQKSHSLSNENESQRKENISQRN